MGWPLRHTLVVLLALSLATVACSGKKDDTGTAGATLRDGLVVPEGGRLIGPVFPLFGEPGDDNWLAMLLVERDPFGTWDRFAEQARGAGWDLTGSGGRACLWRSTDGAFFLEPGAPVPSEAVGLECHSTAVETRDGKRLELTVELAWDPDEQLMAIERHSARGAGSEEPIDRTRAGVPEDDVPPGPDADAPLAEAGEPFGEEHNCFARGYDRFVVPDGAELAGPTSYVLSSDTAVLTVDEPDEVRTVMEDLTRQLVEDGRGADPPPVEETGVPGGPVLSLRYSVDGGGGSCRAQSSPDGRWLLVQTHSD